MRPMASSSSGNGPMHASRSYAGVSQVPSVASTDGSSHQTKPSSSPSTDDSYPSTFSHPRRNYPSPGDRVEWAASSPTRKRASGSQSVPNSRNRVPTRVRTPSPTSYRPDYSRAQHSSVPDESYAASDSGTMPYPSPDHARFSAYVNRFASHDPRASPIPGRKPAPDSRRRETKAPSERIHRFQSASLQTAPTDELKGQISHEQRNLDRVPTDELQSQGGVGNTHMHHSNGRPQPLQTQPLRSRQLRSVKSESLKYRQRNSAPPTTPRLRETVSVAAPDRPRGTTDPPDAHRHPSPRPSEPARAQFLPPSPRERRQRSLALARRERRQLQQPHRDAVPRHNGLQEPTTEANSNSLREAQTGPSQKAEVYGIDQESIETPTPAKIKDLKKQLWDGDEMLQVQVRPSLHGYGEPERFNKHWLHFNGPEMAGSKGERMARTRSLSPNRRPHRGSAGSDVNLPTSAVPGDTAPTFKSKFYQAAMVAQRGSAKSPVVNEPVAVTQSARPKSQPSSPARHSWGSPPGVEPSSSSNQVDRAYSSSGSGIAENTVARLVAKLNSIDRQDPATALAKIDSILKAESFSNASVGNPSGEDILPPGTLTPVDGASPTPESDGDGIVQLSTSSKDIHLLGDEEETTEADSDEETSVSSITNPTYQRDTHDAAPPGVATASFRRPRPSALQGYTVGHAERAKSPVQQERRSKSSKSRKIRSPPPPTIDVSRNPRNESKDTSDKTLTPENDTGNHASPGRTTGRKLDAFISNQSVAGDNAAAIALKIRVWDEMSNPSQHQNLNSTQDEDTAETEELGSIVTPAESSSPSRRAHPWDAYHPHAAIEGEDPVRTDYRYGGKSPPMSSSPQPRAMTPDRNVNTSRKEKAREQATKREASSELSGNAFRMNPNLSGIDDSPFEMPSTANRVASSGRVETKSISEDYDSAWVALPPSSFFGEKNTKTRSKPAYPSREPKPSLPQDITDAFATQVDLNELAPPIDASVSRPQQEIDPPASERRGRKPRRGFLKSIMRKKNTRSLLSSSQPPPFTDQTPSEKRNKNTPLVGAYAMGSVMESDSGRRSGSRRRFSRSRSPGRRRSKSSLPSSRPSWDEDDTEETSSFGSARSRNSRLARTFSRLRKG